MDKKNLWSLLAPLSLLLVFGLTTVWSTTPTLFISQLVFLLSGILIFLFISFFDRKLIESLATPLYVTSILLLLFTYFLGSVSHGSVRWIDLGPFRFQPSEFAKPILIVSLSHFFSSPQKNQLAFFIRSLILLTLPTLLVLFQPDLGSAIIIFIIGLSLLFRCGLPTKYPLGFLMTLTLLSPLAINFLHPYQLARLESFINPYADPSNTGYNVIQATIAVGSGQLLGKGVRQGTQSHLRFLPERHTDFAFASFAEEFGFIGVLLSFSCYFFFLKWFITPLERATDLFSRLILTGTFWLFFAQSIINIGMNIGVMPVTGIPLPFISYGGSSMISSFIVLGIAVVITNSQKIEF